MKATERNLEGVKGLSKYTTQLRFICETAAGRRESAGYDDSESIIKAAHTKIFDFDYPIFDAAYKETLECKIIDHYYTQEIGFETVGQFKRMLRATMREIMPLYNELYTSGLRVLNPLTNIDIEDSFTKSSESQSENSSTGSSSMRRDGTNAGTVTDEGSSTTETSGTESETIGREKASAPKNTRWDIYSDTPQGALSNVENETYLTNARKITDDGTGSSETDDEERSTTRSDTVEGETTNTRTISGTDSDTTSGNTKTDDTGHAQTTEEYVLKRIGRSGLDVVALAEQMRHVLLDIDQMIIADLQPLFMGLW